MAPPGSMRLQQAFACLAPGRACGRQPPELAGNVIDPPTWCGAATTTFVRGTWRPHPLWRSSLVEPGANVTVIVFTEETWWPSSNTLSECYNNVDVGVPLWLQQHLDNMF